MGSKYLLGCGAPRSIGILEVFYSTFSPPFLCADQFSLDVHTRMGVHGIQKHVNKLLQEDTWHASSMSLLSPLLSVPLVLTYMLDMRMGVHGMQVRA